MDILYTPKFTKQYKKLPNDLKKIAEDKENVFRKDPFDTRLKTHKLHGKFVGLFSFSINYKYRIVFNFTESKQDVIFLTIGTHDIYE